MTKALPINLLVPAPKMCLAIQNQNIVRVMTSEEIEQRFDLAESCGDFFILYKELQDFPPLQSVCLEKMIECASTFSQAYLVFQKSNSPVLKERAVFMMIQTATSYGQWGIIREISIEDSIQDLAREKIHDCLHSGEVKPIKTSEINKHVSFQSLLSQLETCGLRSGKRQVILHEMFECAKSLQEWRQLWFELTNSSPLIKRVRDKISELNAENREEDMKEENHDFETLADKLRQYGADSVPRKVLLEKMSACAQNKDDWHRILTESVRFPEIATQAFTMLSS